MKGSDVLDIIMNMSDTDEVHENGVDSDSEPIIDHSSSETEDNKSIAESNQSSEDVDDGYLHSDQNRSAAGTASPALNTTQGRGRTSPLPSP